MSEPWSCGGRTPTQANLFWDAWVGMVAMNAFAGMNNAIRRI
ncbi:hypothetical protein [Spirosoma aerophilum]